MMIKCPVCGKYTFAEKNDYDTCPVCGWVNDDFQRRNPEVRHCANVCCLREAREKWQQGERFL